MTLTDFLLARIADDERDAEANLLGWHPNLWRAQAECEAKRRIVADHEWDETPGSPVRHSRELRHLATVYVDHPDYREEWRP